MDGTVACVGCDICEVVSLCGLVVAVDWLTVADSPTILPWVDETGLGGDGGAMSKDFPAVFSWTRRFVAVPCAAFVMDFSADSSLARTGGGTGMPIQR